MPRPLRRHLLCLVTETAGSVELSGELSWGEARVALGRLRRLFTDREARDQGWTVTSVPRGFVVSHGRTAVTFRIAEAAAVDLLGSSAGLASGLGLHGGSPVRTGES